MQSTLLVCGCPTPHNHGMRLSSQMLLQDPHQPRLANPSLPLNDCDASASLLGLLPARHQQAYLMLPPNKGCEAAGRHDVQAMVCFTFSHDTIGLEGGSQPLARLGIERVTEKITVDELIGRLADHYRVRRRALMKLRSQRGCVPQHPLGG